MTLPPGATTAPCRNCKAAIALPGRDAVAAGQARRRRCLPGPPGGGGTGDVLDLADRRAPRKSSPSPGLARRRRGRRHRRAGRQPRRRSSGAGVSKRARWPAMDLDAVDLSALAPKKGAGPLAGAMIRRVFDLPAPISTAPAPAPMDLDVLDLPAPVSTGGLGGVDLPAPVSRGGGGPAGRPRRRPAASPDDLLAPVGAPVSGGSDPPAPVRGGSDLADLPRPKRASVLGDVPSAPRPRRRAPSTLDSMLDLPAPKGGGADLPAPKGLFDDLPAPSTAPRGAPTAGAQGRRR
ncbi:MAG: hypothetical protein R2939_00290 [Kofleriaceae bacterium]